LQKTRHIDFVLCDRVFDGSGHRTEGRSRENIFYPLGGFAAVFYIKDITYLQGKRFGIFFQQVKQVLDLSGGKDIKYFYNVSSLQECLLEVLLLITRKQSSSKYSSTNISSPFYHVNYK